MSDHPERDRRNDPPGWLAAVGFAIRARGLILAIVFPWLGPVINFIFAIPDSDFQLVQFFVVPIAMLLFRAWMATSRVEELNVWGDVRSRIRGWGFQAIFALALIALWIFEAMTVPFQQFWSEPSPSSVDLGLSAAVLGVAYAAYIVLSLASDVVFARSVRLNEAQAVGQWD